MAMAMAMARRVPLQRSQTLAPLLLLGLALLAALSPLPSSARLGARSCHGSLFFSDSASVSGALFIGHGDRTTTPPPCLLLLSAPALLLRLDQVTSGSFFLRESVRDCHALLSLHALSLVGSMEADEHAAAAASASSSSASPVFVNDEQAEKEDFQTLRIDATARRSPWPTFPSIPVRTPWTDSLRFPRSSLPQRPVSSDSLDESAQFTASSSSLSSQDRPPWMDSLRFPYKVSLTQKASSHQSATADSQRPTRLDLLRSSLVDAQQSSWIDSLRSLMWISTGESPANPESKKPVSTVDSQQASWIRSDGTRGIYRSLPHGEYDDSNGDSSWIFTVNELTSIAFSLLLGAACGAIVAGVFSLVWSFFSRESDDDDDDDYDVADEKDMGALHSYQLLESPKACEKLDKPTIKGDEPESKV